MRCGRSMFGHLYVTHLVTIYSFFSEAIVSYYFHAATTAYTCSCNASYVGAQCQTEIDECASSPCQNAALCMDLVDGFYCNCTGIPFGGALCQNPLLPGNLFFFSVFLAFHSLCPSLFLYQSSMSFHPKFIKKKNEQGTVFFVHMKRVCYRFIKNRINRMKISNRNII
jgi:EGF-like domain